MELVPRSAYSNFRSPGGYDISWKRVQYEVDHHTPLQNPATIERALYECNRILGWHLGNGWGDIGYTYLVHDKYAIEGRGYGRTGAHAPGANSNSIGIAFLLDGRDRAPTAREWLTAREIMELGVAQGYVIPSYSVTGHRDWVSTECPAARVYNKLHDPRLGPVLIPVLVPPPEHHPARRKPRMLKLRVTSEDKPVVFGEGFAGHQWQTVAFDGMAAEGSKVATHATDDRLGPYNASVIASRFPEPDQLFGPDIASNWSDPWFKSIPYDAFVSLIVPANVVVTNGDGTVKRGPDGQPVVRIFAEVV